LGFGFQPSVRFTDSGIVCTVCFPATFCLMLLVCLSSALGFPRDVLRCSVFLSFFNRRRLHKLTFCLVRERKYGGSILSTRASISCVTPGLREYQLKWSQSCPRVLLRLAPSNRLRMLPLPT
jgi:hypothetical protein